MALRLRFKLTRLINPNVYLLKTLWISTSAPDPVSRPAPTVGRSLTSDDDEEKLKVQVNVKEGADDGVSIRKRMLAKMREEWKVFKERKMPQQKEMGISSVGKLGEEDEAEAELGEVLSGVETEERGKTAEEENGMCEGLVRSMEEESMYWTLELGEVEESSVAVAVGNSKGVKGEQGRLSLLMKKERGKKVRIRASTSLDDTLRMLKTKKSKLKAVSTIKRKKGRKKEEKEPCQRVNDNEFK